MSSNDRPWQVPVLTPDHPFYRRKRAAEAAAARNRADGWGDEDEFEEVQERPEEAPRSVAEWRDPVVQRDLPFNPREIRARYMQAQADAKAAREAARVQAEEDVFVAQIKESEAASALALFHAPRRDLPLDIGSLGEERSRLAEEQNRWDALRTLQEYAVYLEGPKIASNSNSSPEAERYYQAVDDIQTALTCMGVIGPDYDAMKDARLAELRARVDVAQAREDAESARAAARERTRQRDEDRMRAYDRLGSRR